MDVKHVLYRFAFTIYSAIGQEFSENAVFSPYSAFISTVVSAAISPNDEIYSRFLQYIGLTENLSPEEIISEIQNIIQGSETIIAASPYFLGLLNQFSKKENSEELPFNYMKKSEQFLMFSHIKRKILEYFPEITYDSEDSLFLNFSDFFNKHKKQRRVKRFLKSIEVPISQLRKAPTIICPNLIYTNSSTKDQNLQNKLKNICNDLHIEYQNCKFPQPAVDQINQFIDEQTNKTISRIISEESIDKSTKILNVNSILFDAKWEKFFATVELQDFHLYSGEKRQIKTMILRHKKCQYFENDSIQVLQLNYACSQFSMVYILNKNAQSVHISNSELEKAVDSLTETDVYIEMPRFEAEFGPASIDACFPPELAVDANKNFVKIIQKVKIGNYEEGTSPTQPGEKWRSSPKKRVRKRKKKKVNVDGETENKDEEKVTDTNEENETFLTENKDAKAPEPSNSNVQIESSQDATESIENTEHVAANVDSTIKSDPNLQIESSAVGTESIEKTEHITANVDSTIKSDSNMQIESSAVGTESIESVGHISTENASKLGIEIPTNVSSVQMSDHITGNKINTATSPTTSATDINLPFQPEEDEEEDDPYYYDEEDEDDDSDLVRSGATAEFICNHPFLFFVINRQNHVVLLMGTITDPIAVDLQPLTIDQRADNFLASIRGEELPHPPGILESEVPDKKSLWDEIDQIGNSPSQPTTSKPTTPQDEVKSDEKDEVKSDEKITLEAQIDEELLEYVYEGKPKPKPDKKRIDKMFGYESKKKKTFSSFSPWSDVVFFKANSSLSTYKPIEKPKYPRGPKLPPLPPLSNLSATNWDELEKELHESGMSEMHSSAVKKMTPKLIEPKTKDTLSLRGTKIKRY